MIWYNLYKYLKLIKCMKKLKLGRIPTESITKTRVALKAVYPKAMSVNAIIQAIMIKQTTVIRILQYLELLGDVEKIDTTAGVFWKWRLRNGNRS